MITTKDKNEIKRWLLEISRKISELDEAEEFNNSDYLAIVQEEDSVKYSRKVTLSDFVAYISSRVGASDGASFYGIAHPSDSSVDVPTGSDAFWFAIDDGTYTQYGNTVVNGTPKVIYYNGTTGTWSSEDLWVSKGPKGDTGDTGPQGPQGPAGPGVPAGGSAGQVLAKSSSSDYATEWVNPSGGTSITVEDNLNSTSTTSALSANQGRVLKELIDSGFLFKGVATTSTNPGTVTQKCFYLAGEGTYTNFGNISVPSGNIGVLTWNNSWSVSLLEVGTGGGGGTMNYQKVTQAEYDAMYSGGTLSNSILYVIVD